MSLWPPLMDLFAPRTQILFVCSANICRSPLAEGLLRHRIKEQGLQRKLNTRSAGTRASMPGHKPDVRAQRIAAEAGVSLSGIRARQIRSKDFVSSDFVVAMDTANLESLKKMCPGEHQHKIRLLMSFVPELGIAEVPDPYFGNFQAFEEVYQLIDTGITGLLGQIC